MFTTEQIRVAHSKVKSGADFPAYIKEIKELGVTHYETYVTDGHTDYHGSKNYKATTPAKYDSQVVASSAKTEEFKADLKAHQQGKTDYLKFIRMCAAFGIKKWQVNIKKMTCTYFDSAENEILIEKIPG